jgi:16S rRNA (adenine1518-N6/adenine1519-N6)-dimethyltransferase
MTEKRDQIAHKIDALPPLRDVIEANDLRADKSMGQNFLLDLNLTDKIARLGGSLEGLDVIEVGPGPGGLTRRLVAQNARHVTALEKDRRAIKALASLIDAADGRLEVREQDALEADLLTIGDDGKRAIIANLPYNVATPLLIGWLHQIHIKGADAYQFMALMFQKEVADRICAPLGSKAYGRISVISQAVCGVRVQLTLPPSAFTPPPKIKSAIVVFRPREKLDDFSLSVLETITQSAFGQRRKMIRSSLKEYVSILELLGIESTKRAEELSVQDYINIAKAVEKGQS